MSQLRLRWAGATDVGRHRQNNEDSILAGPELFIVADGMGGHAAGDVASQLTIETIVDELPRGAVPPPTLRRSPAEDDDADTQRDIPIVADDGPADGPRSGDRTDAGRLPAEHDAGDDTGQHAHHGNDPVPVEDRQGIGEHPETGDANDPGTDTGTSAGTDRGTGTANDSGTPIATGGAHGANADRTSAGTNDGSAATTHSPTEPGDVPVTRIDHLIAAVHAANEVVFAESIDNPERHGMGTTVVAIGVVVEDGEERIGIVNVGDSRAYRLTRQDFHQVSHDHSHVGELVRDGRITAEEARTHPHKNLVTRAIGIEEYVDVDEFQLLPHTGDRYLLCSDGLTDEVTDDEIAAILRANPDPDDAARALVDTANDHGGRDNITVVIVDVIDDGLDAAKRAANVAAAARESIPDDAGFRHDTDEDTATLAAVPVDPSGSEPKAPRTITLRTLAFVVAVLLVLGTGAFLLTKSIRDTYFVGLAEDGETISIYRGRDVLWFSPTLADADASDLEFDDLPEVIQDEILENKQHSSIAKAREFLDALEERAEETSTPVSTTSTTSTTEAPAPGESLPDTAPESSPETEPSAEPPGP